MVPEIVLVRNPLDFANKIGGFGQRAGVRRR